MGSHSGRQRGANHKSNRSNLMKSISNQNLQNTETELSDIDLKYLEENTGIDKCELNNIYHKFMRESLNSELDLDRFVLFYRSLTDNPPDFLDENPQFIFDTFDKDHNGKISFREFVFAYSLTFPGNLEKKLKYTFELYDMDNDGYLDIDEIYR